MRSVLLACAAASMLTGCASTLLSDDRIKSSTEMALGQPSGTITISDRRYDGVTNTYYRARTPGGSYSCVINGGTVLSFGMVNPAQCNRL